MSYPDRATARPVAPRGGARAVRRTLRPTSPSAGATPFQVAGYPAPAIPIFPKRDYIVTAFGAIDDDRTDCGPAINSAIKACATAGGGRVVIPAGRWFTGAIHLRSNVNLHVAGGATVRFSDDPADYQPAVFVRWEGLECHNFCPLIYARDCENVAITGAGRLLGQGEKWWPWQRGEERSTDRLYRMVLQGVPVEERLFGNVDEPLRPQFILAINCKNVLLESFVIAEGGPFWTVHLAYCDDATVRNVSITADGPNANGVVIDSSRNVLVEDCTLHTRDDCIALKSGLNEDGWRVDRPTEYVTLRRITGTHGHGGITIGSEMSGGVRNILAHDCRFSGLQFGLRLKAARGRGGVVENIDLRDIALADVAADAIQITTEYSTFVSPDGRPPAFRNVSIRNVTCDRAQTAVRLIGQADSALQDIHLEDIRIASNEGVFCSAGNHISLVNVHVTPTVGAMFSVKDSQEVLINGLNGVGNGERVFLDLRGRKTRNIRLRGEPSHSVRPMVVLGVDVPRDSLLHE